MNAHTTDLAPAPTTAGDPEALSMTRTTQFDLEEMFSKHQLHSCIRQTFLDAGVADVMEQQGIPSTFGIDLLIQMVLHKRTTVPVLTGILKKHFEDNASIDNPAQFCADMILVMVDLDWLDWEDMSQQLIIRIDIPDAVKARMEIFQYPLPMIEKPDPVTNNRQTGYQSIRGSLLLKNNHHDEDICLDHINRSNAIPLALNADVVAFVQNQWKDLSAPKEGESRQDYVKRVTAFEKYDRVSRDVLAALMAQGDRFWLTHKYDKRGRTYSQGYHVNPQGNDWNKACVEFADAELLNEE